MLSSVLSGGRTHNNASSSQSGHVLFIKQAVKSLQTYVLPASPYFKWAAAINHANNHEIGMPNAKSISLEMLNKKHVHYVVLLAGISSMFCCGSAHCSQPAITYWQNQLYNQQLFFIGATSSWMRRIAIATSERYGVCLFCVV